MHSKLGGKLIPLCYRIIAGMTALNERYYFMLVSELMIIIV